MTAALGPMNGIPARVSASAAASMTGSDRRRRSGPAGSVAALSARKRAMRTAWPARRSSSATSRPSPRWIHASGCGRQGSRRTVRVKGVGARPCVDAAARADAEVTRSLLQRDTGHPLPDFAQLRLEARGVLGAHADESLLARRTRLERRIGILVQHPGPCELDRTGHGRRREQMVDHLDQPIVEVMVRIPEVRVGLLEEGIEADV